MSSDSPLSQFSTCELSDALIKLGVPTGGHIPDINMYSPGSSPSGTRICGPAYTVQMVSATDKTSPSPSAHFVDSIPTGTVVIIDAPPESKNAVWGGLMTAGAQVRGALGVVILGRCRDLAEHRSLGFPVFARGHSTLGQGGFTRPSAVDVPLTVNFGSDDSKFQSVVTPRDWIIADEDGVVCVPTALVDRVVEVATKGREVDCKCMEDILAGKGVQASFKLHRGKL
ncbi:ribonuclease E inhibitor RraA/Dimethylmenaquinone methyltransferase [Cristinia sonorae]|uniref:Ribonuclease E inhibitor RraA/Dimethylmenaquinone methyltransferase n=1 Tax=Cristinia sonorae TaxID=1940300 RepID=A0A8K0V0C5_9AGAR|nr:ribonuclease E inhibitor RraA/Dimethylmenaquinone methyltransferase [Cristinia sonorae]